MDYGKDTGLPVVLTLYLLYMQVIGFATRAVPEQLPEDFRGEDRILVCLPLSYMIGGYAVLMPRSAVRPQRSAAAQGVVCCNSLFGNQPRKRTKELRELGSPEPPVVVRILACA